MFLGHGRKKTGACRFEDGDLDFGPVLDIWDPALASYQGQEHLRWTMLRSLHKIPGITLESPIKCRGFPLVDAHGMMHSSSYSIASWGAQGKLLSPAAHLLS